MNPPASDLELLKLLAARLERLSADSHWAHRASGIRGQVLRTLDRIESGSGDPGPDLSPLIQAAFKVLENAAREIS